MTLIRELIDIPTQVQDGDFVLKLTSGVTDDHAAATIDSYEVTPQLIDAFTEALGLIAGSVESGNSQATYLHGSFGSGKSHFMAVLHLLLSGHPAALAKPELHQVIAAHTDRLDGKKHLLVPVHFLDARSMEQKILGGYLERVRALHPDAPTPAVFIADEILAAELPDQRRRLGEQAFLDELNAATGSDTGDWGDFGATWTTDAVDAAFAPQADPTERQSLAAAYIDAYRGATSSEALVTGAGFIDLSRGLATISAHARGLGYDSIVLFLDELILWLASNIGNLDLAQREAQKLTNLTEGDAANRPVPIVSFVARQRDLSELVGDHVAGSERVSFADMLTLQSGRFGQITLEARNLPVIAKRRLLRPVDDNAAQQLRDAVDQALAGRSDVRDVLLGDDADIELFRTVYPFSPTLVRALIDVAEALQRERTALKVMLQLLVDQRDELKLGQIIPVGDLWDVIAARDEPFAPEMRPLFERAKRLYRTRLRPMLLGQHHLSDEADPADPRWAAFRGDDRLIKTILLAALVPGVDAFRNLDAGQLTSLNWGSITSPIPGRETQMATNKLRNWSAEIGELKVSDDPGNPTVAVTLVDVDPDDVIKRASDTFDNVGTRRQALRALINAELDDRLGGDLTTTFPHQWRGTERGIDITFGNVRDATELPDVALQAGGGRPKVIIDFPFDESGRTTDDDLSRLDDWSATNQPTRTVCWLPSFLNRDGLRNLGRFVALDHLLRGENFSQHTAHLAHQQRRDLRPVLESMHSQLRDRLRNAIHVAYGIHTGHDAWVDPTSGTAEHFRSLDPSLTVEPPTAATLLGALERVSDQLLANQYPGHPTFDQKVTAGMLRTTWEEVQRAIGDPEGRITVESTRRAPLRTVANALQLGTMHESHFVVSQHWANQLDRHLAAAKASGKPLTVSDIRNHIDEIDGGPRGLPHQIADLIVLTVAAQTDHALHQGGIATTPPAGKPLDGTIVLQPEQLPDRKTWKRATEVAGAVFGLNPNSHVTGPEVAKLARDLRAQVAKLGDAPQQLVGQIAAAEERWKLDAGDRHRNARTGTDLIQALRGADGLRATEVLAELDAPTSLHALARSLHTAGEVTKALAATNWGLLNLAKETVQADVATLLHHDEIVTTYSAKRHELEAKATQWLAQNTPPTPDDPATTPGPSRTRPPRQDGNGTPVAPDQPTPPAPPAAKPAEIVVTASANNTPDLTAQLSDIEAALREHGSVRLTWHKPDTP